MASVAQVQVPAEVVPTAMLSKGCGKQCMGPCCLPGSSLPRYCYPRHPLPVSARRNLSYSNLSQCASTTSLADSQGSGKSSASDGSSSDEEAPLGEGRRSFLDALLVSMWDERVEEGLFRYSVSACETRAIPGSRGFVAQFNEGRHSKKRPTEFALDAVLQPFDKSKFNFTKVGQREALIAFEDSSLVPGENGGENAAAFVEDAAVPLSGDGMSANIVAINVSPIEYGHVLLIPRVLDGIAQSINAPSLLLALRFAAEVDNPHFRLGYNSLGAFATVNHLHFQGYYLQQPFAIELASTAPLWGPMRAGGVSVLELQDYPVRGLAFEVGDSPRQAAELIGALCGEMQSRNVPFNLFVSRCGARVFFYPQCYAERQARGEVESDLLETEVNPAVFEISGHMVMKKREDFESIDEALAVRLLAAVSLSEEAFKEVRELCLELVEKGLSSA